MFTAQKLQQAFPPSEWKKGERLYKKNLVRSIDEDEVGIFGEVASETYSKITYDSELVYYESIDKILTECDCPVGSYCKHAAALAHAYLSEINAGVVIEHDAKATTKNQPPPVQLPLVVNNWLNDLTKQETKANKSNKEERALFYYLTHYDHHKAAHKGLNVVSKKRNKNGSWSKNHSHEYFGSSLLTHQAMSPADFDALLPIMRSGGYAASSSITEFEMYEKLVATNRLYWLPNDMSGEAIRLGEDKQVNWQWQQVGDDEYQINLALTPDDLDLHIIACHPLAYYNRNTRQIGKLLTQVDKEQNLKLLKSPVVNKQALPRVITKLQQVCKSLIEKVPAPSDVKTLKAAKPIITITLFNKPESHYSGTLKLNFQYDDVTISPHFEHDSVATQSGKMLLRDLESERNAIEYLKQQLFQYIHPYGYYTPNSQAAYLMGLQGKANCFQFLHQEIPKLTQQGWQITIEPDFPYQLMETTSTFDAEINEEHDRDFFSVGLNLDLNGESVPAFPILQNALEKLPPELLQNPNGTENNAELNQLTESSIYVELDQGKFVALEVKKILPFVKQFIELFMPENINQDGKLKLSYLQSPQTLSFLDDQGIMAKGAKRARELANKLTNFEQVADVAPPNGLQAELRNYQQQGLNWLQFLREYQLNGILADDMGLGKTIQTLSHLQTEKEQGRLTAPCMILAPTSVIYNWQNEIKKFTPDLSTVVISGNKRQKDLSQFKQYDVVITSYALLPRDVETYLTKVFYYLVLDEAHYIKNPKTKLYTAVASIKAKHKLCLTGTPMENHLGEFWSQFNFLSPGFLGGHKQFTKLFRTPIEKHGDGERKQLLHNRLKPFILRRTKEKIAKDLPAKTEIVQTLKLEGKQAELYESVRLSMDSKISQLINDKGIKRSQIEILDALLKLRQVCNHPQLLPLASAKKVKQSAKLEFLMDTVPELIAEGRKILIFSQFTSMLSLIEEAFAKVKVDYLKLTGASKNRQELVDEFQNGQVPVFLISLKAGGVGLNLTAADTVIHFDPWWNPAVENQATDRAHRIGQDKPVFVYKLIVENSIEQTIQNIQKNKAQLAKALLSEETSDKKLTLTQDIVSALMAPIT